MTVRGAQLADALAELAVTFERDENPIQAIHCLQALVDQKQTADREAIARLHLGRLLLQHTVSLEDAQKILLKAVSHCSLGALWSRVSPIGRSTQHSAARNTGTLQGARNPPIPTSYRFSQPHSNGSVIPSSVTTV